MVNSSPIEQMSHKEFLSVHVHEVGPQRVDHYLLYPEYVQLAYLRKEYLLFVRESTVFI